MWTRGRDKTQPGKFEFELWSGFDLIERVGGFDTAQDADRAAELAQRRALLGAPVETPLTDAEWNMTDDELLAALRA